MSKPIAAERVGTGWLREDEGFKDENSAYIKGSSSQLQHQKSTGGPACCTRFQWLLDQWIAEIFIIRVQQSGTVDTTWSYHRRNWRFNIDQVENWSTVNQRVVQLMSTGVYLYSTTAEEIGLSSQIESITIHR